MHRSFALPGTPARYAPDRTCDIQHLKIELDLDVASRRIAGTCTVTLTPIIEDVAWVELDAVELEIAAVRSAGRALAFSHDGRVLRVDLGRKVATGQTVELEIAYAGSPRRGLYFVGPDAGYPDKPRQVWTQGQDEDSRYWFPCFDSPHEKATSEVIATVPDGFFVLSNGALVDTRHDAARARKTFHWRFDLPHSCYLITLVAGELAELRQRWEDIDVLYYVAPGREADAERTLRRTPEMLALFSRLFGVRYPYDKYAQVFVADFIFGGMENTTATTLTDAILLDERAALDLDFESLVAHELAHQWFGDLLTCRDWGQGWLNEGFATYAEYLWREHAEGRDAAALELDEWAEQYFGEDASRYRRPVATNVYDEPIDIFDHHLYEKGGLVLHMLRRVLGDDAFWRSIGHYLRKHRSGVVETRDLARAVEEASGRVLDWFFDQWILRGTGHPELAVEYAWEADRKLARFTIKQTHKVVDDTPLFRIPAVVRFRTAAGDRDLEIELREQQQSFFFAFDAEPVQAIFDPGKTVLAKLKTDKGMPLWIAELRGATEAIDRIHAARALARQGGAQATEALVEALRRDPFWAVRAAAAAALGTLRGDASRDALIAAVATTEHPRARRAVVRALGEFRRDEQVAAVLAALIERGDASYFVEAEACLALGKLRSPRAPEVLRAALARDSFTDVIRQHVYRGLAEGRFDAELPVVVAGTAYGKVSQGRRAAVGALAQLAKGRRDREARDVRERAEELLRDPDFRVQSAAIEALATIGDPAAVPALEAVVDRELDGRLRRRAREVVRDIQEGRAREEQLASLRDELERLRGESFKLRDRLQKLETQNGGPSPKPPNGQRAAAKPASKPAAKPARKPAARGKPVRAGRPSSRR